MTQPNQQFRNLTFNQTFESSLVEKSNQKFTFDKSLIKGIKENDVSKIIDQNQVRGGDENQQLFDEYKELQAIVIDTRKRYDETKTDLQKHQQEIQKMKKQKELLLADESKYNEIIQRHRKQLDLTTKKLQEISSLMESTIYRKDQYQNIKDIVKHDLLILKKRYFDKDVKLMRDSTKLRTLKTEHQSKMKMSKRCREMVDSVQKSHYATQMDRNTKIQSFCDVLNKKQANRQNREIRDRQIIETMMFAMTDKLAEEKQWIKMLNANLFLKGMLRHKMQKMMEKFQYIELSFHKMKQATSIKDSNEFIQRYLNRQETYGYLLQSISEKQKQLQNLKEEKDELQKVNTTLIYKNEDMGDEKKKNQKDLKNQNPNTDLQKLNEKILEISRKQQLAYQWGIKFLSAFNGHRNKNQMIKNFPKTKKKELLIEVLKQISSFLTNLQTQQNHSKKIDQAFLKNNPKQRIMTEQMFEKNTRVKTMSTFENYQGGLDTFQDKDMAYDDLSETDYLQYNRRAIKKTDLLNRKFRIKTKPY